MATTRIVFNRSGLRQILQSPAMGALVGKAARDIADRAQAGYQARSGRGVQGYSASQPMRGGYGGGRCVAFVNARGGGGLRDQALHHRLERAIQSSAVGS